MTSECEQFGQVLVEGMACELPAAATDSLGPASIIDDGETGWLVPDAEGALASALVEVVQNDGERQRRGELARAAVHERYSWSRVTGELAALLEEVAERARERAPTLEA